MIVLALNAGSSSVKTALFEVDETTERLLARGAVSSLNGAEGALRIEDAEGRELSAKGAPGTDAARATRLLLDAIRDAPLPRADAVGHRLVHGGPHHQKPERLDDELRNALEAVTPFAPIHLPMELEVIDVARATYPDLPGVVCYDTGFHRTLPEVARRLPLPRELHDSGIRRYGFHGLSYEGIVRTLGPEKLGRAVLAHLGSGASMAAVKDGVCIDTTMGLTPTGGLVMGKRTGDLDPGVLLHLLEQKGMSPREVEAMVNERSGLFAISEGTADMKTLLEASRRDSRAALAVEAFCYSARKAIGALAAALGGIDSLVFTGGIGERSADVRARICDGLAHLGVTLAPRKGESGVGLASPLGSRVEVRVVRADEERMIARHVWQALGPCA